MRVVCTLGNMSESVSGVRFTQTPDGQGWISDDLTPALAAAFAEIPGYQLLAEPESEKDQGKPVQQPIQPAKAKS